MSAPLDEHDAQLPSSNSVENGESVKRKQHKFRPLFLKPVDNLGRGKSRLIAQPHHRRTSSVLLIDHPFDCMETEEDMLWPTMSCIHNVSPDNESVTSDLSINDEETSVNSQGETCVDSSQDDDEIPNDAWIAEVMESEGKLEPGDTPWFRILKKGSHGYLMLEGDEILQLLRAMIKDAAIHQNPQPILYTRLAAEHDAKVPLPAREALTFFRAILKATNRAIGKRNEIVEIASQSKESVERINGLAM